MLQTETDKLESINCNSFMHVMKATWDAGVSVAALQLEGTLGAGVDLCDVSQFVPAAGFSLDTLVSRSKKHACPEKAAEKTLNRKKK